ncbi:hypothetical protein Rs2_10275 [Raphanus sativus]|nr:hypothetical protein Rs2_10275 [Raphanus sativus]
MGAILFGAQMTPYPSRNSTLIKVAGNKHHVAKALACLANLLRRCVKLENKLAAAEVSEEEQNNLLKDLELKETEYTRRQSLKMGVDDFEPLTMIGKGAFGEVLLK